MDVIGTCRADVMLGAEMPRVLAYLSDHQKILGFNPFCKRVVATDRPGVYRWDFEVVDPQGHPIKLIFFVRQSEEQTAEGRELRVGQYTLPEGASGNKIVWTNVPVVIDGKLPDDRTYLGKAFGDMTLRKADAAQTYVSVSIRIEIDFTVPFLLRVFPESVLRTMSETAMTFAMQHVSAQMMKRISKDFQYSLLDGAVHKMSVPS